MSASVKKHEAISADILARGDRFHDLAGMARQLAGERYHRSHQIQTREAEIMARWEELLALLASHKEKLERYSAVISLQREIETLATTIAALQAELDTGESGSHLLDVQEKLQKFQLQESQVHAMAETIRKVGKQSKSALGQQELQDSQRTAIETKEPRQQYRKIDF